MRAQVYLRLSDLQKYLKKQYDVVFESNQSYYNLLKEAGITWKKLTHINPAKNDELAGL
ncbi:transposase [Trichodesmium erythraeum IMS101]|uniref:Transposase n=1 Tax=Trichodesmium erythraeum (strain IMS101) TaxID=203124 RepID=Q115Y2_TRIEI